MSPRRVQPTEDSKHEGLPSGREASERERPIGQHEQVSAIQRARILAAMREICCEHREHSVTVAHVAGRAGISRRTFYELFENCDECFLAALEEGLARISAAVLPAWQAQGAWRERIRAALIELLSFLDGDPVTGRLVVVETLGAGHRALERRGRVLALLIAAVEEGRGEAKQGQAPPPLTGEGVVGAVTSVIYGRTVEGSKEPLLELTGPLMSMIVLPYLGPVAARRELQRPVPARAPSRARPPAEVDGHALADLPMRLTYRTLCVLGAIAALPGASNRQIGKASGIEDQGQISKLLKRLQRIGLIENGNANGADRGMPNAWKLTVRGEQITRSLAPASP
jgi:AcrR family transcriptional regulator/DNA-binding MarR family transcriptional regulator